MKRVLLRLPFQFGITIFLFGATACQTRQQAMRTGTLVTGTAAGAALGYAVGDQKPLATGLGALGGALLSHLAQGKDPAVAQEGFDKGYVQGQSDALKRHYFLRQALEQRPLPSKAQGQPTTYLLPAPPSSEGEAQSRPTYLPFRVYE